MGTWTTEKLDRLCSIRIGGTPARSNPLYWDTAKSGTNLWASIKDLRNHVVEDTEERITDSGVRHSNAKLVKKGTVLLSFKLTIGRVAFAGRDLYTNEAIAALETYQIDQNFLYYGLQHWNLLAGVDQAIKGTTLNKEKLANIEAHLPVSRDEQSKIAEILSTVDRAIEQTEALIAKYQRIKTGLMLDLLTRGIDENGRLRDPATHRFKPSLLGQIPEEWDCVRSEELCSNICVGIVIKPSQYYREAGVPTLRSANIRERGVVLDDMVFISEGSNRILAKSILREGYVVSVRTGYPGTSAVVPPELDGANCVDLVISKPGPKILSQFLAMWINSPFGKDQVLKGQGGLAQQHFNVSEMRNLLVFRPEIDEQEAILNILNANGEVLRLESNRLTKLQKLKTGLMQDLLTGKVPVDPLLETQTAS